jgi:integration host factor subunit beta
MIRSELVARVAAQNPRLYAKEVEGAVDAILERIATALASGDRVELRDFGAFSLRHHSARSGRNPQTGAVVAVAERTSAYFRPGKAMRERLNLGPKR